MLSSQSLKVLLDKSLLRYTKYAVTRTFSYLGIHSSLAR